MEASEGSTSEDDHSGWEHLTETHLAPSLQDFRYPGMTFLFSWVTWISYCHVKLFCIFLLYFATILIILFPPPPIILILEFLSLATS